MEKCIGTMVLYTKVNGLMGNSMGMAFFTWLMEELKREFLKRIGLCKGKK